MLLGYFGDVCLKVLFLVNGTSLYNPSLKEKENMKMLLIILLYKWNLQASTSSLSIRIWCSCGKEDIEKFKLSSASSSLGKNTRNESIN